jgi:hypothetical protein
LVLDGDEWSASSSSRFIDGKEPLVSVLQNVCPRENLDAVEKRKIFSLARN